MGRGVRSHRSVVGGQWSVNNSLILVVRGFGVVIRSEKR